MKIDELKAKVDGAGLQYSKLPDGGGIVPMCPSPAGSRCMTTCQGNCNISCIIGCSSQCLIFTTQE